MFTQLAHTTVTDADFRRIARDLLDASSIPDPVRTTMENGMDIIPMVYRDRDNYRLNYALGRQADGTIWFKEPAWNDDETDIRADFWNDIRDAFATPS